MKTLNNMFRMEYTFLQIMILSPVMRAQQKVLVPPMYYNMFNGVSPYWDDLYSKQPPSEDFEWISGGLGKLTDGYKELTQNFDDTTDESNSPYVGWQKSEYPVGISFHFGKVATIDEVSISIDGPKGDPTDIEDELFCGPRRVIIGGTEYRFPRNPNNEDEGPYEGVIQLDSPIVARQVRINIVRNCDWTFVSEIEFRAVDTDSDGVPDNLDKCPATTADTIDDIGEGNFIYDGTDVVTKDNIGSVIPSSTYTMNNMMGCSCEQVVDMMGPCIDNECMKSGCQSTKLNQWIVSSMMDDNNHLTIDSVSTPSASPTEFFFLSNMPSEESSGVMTLSTTEQYTRP